MATERAESQTIENLVVQLNQRRIDRKLHELGDEGIALLLEAAAIRSEDSQAENAARDLRRHIADGGTPKDFLSQFPQYQGVDFGSLVIDASLLDVTYSSSLLPSLPRPHPEAEKGEWAPSQVAEGPDLALSPAGRLRRDELFAAYPSLDTLFSDESTWTEEGGARLIERKRLQSLLTKKDPEKSMTDTHRTWLMAQLWNEWKEIQPEQIGHYIVGKGKRIYLTQEEAVNFAWFVHNTTQGPTSTYRNYTFAGAIVSAPEDSKKK